MALALVQQANNGGGASSVTSQTVTWGGNTTSGNLIVVGVGYFDNGNTGPGLVTTITDSQSNTYVKVLAATHSSLMGAEIWYAKNIVGGTTPVVTVNFSPNARPGIFINEYSGASTTAPLDQADSGAQAASLSWSFTMASPTTSANEVVVGLFVANQSAVSDGWAVGTGYANFVRREDQGTQAIEDKFITTTGTQTATMSQSQSVAGVIAMATFVQASAGVTLITPSPSLASPSILIQNKVIGY